LVRSRNGEKTASECGFCLPLQLAVREKLFQNIFLKNA